MIYKAWTEDEDSQLLHLRAQGWSLERIARRLGRTRCSCVGRNDRLTSKLSAMQVGRQAQRNDIAVMFDTRIAQCMSDHGGTVNETAARLGVTVMQARTSWRRIKASLGWQAC